jgi:hypothetical protein
MKEKEFEYGKWDSAEDSETAFNAVVSGEWDFNRFRKWVSQVRVDEYRDATANEGL